MTEPTVDLQPGVTVWEFVRDPNVGLQLEVLQGGEGMANWIRSPRIQKLGLALAGFTEYIHPHRIQILGGSEINYLQILEPAAKKAALQGLRGLGICCIVITRGLEPPEGLLNLSLQENIPVLRTSFQSSVSIARITDYLEGRLAPRMTIHGVLLDVFGLGVLLLGPSGIGKSECALELVLKGHRLVSDDCVEIMRHGVDRLVGTGGPNFEHHMELRGLGIINLKELFGISATGRNKTLDFAVRLQRWEKDAEYDRLGLERSSIEFLGVSIPLIEMPVAPGRNVATLIEVAARIHLLVQQGHQPARELLAGLPPATDND
jgi:HPr kinase/phosphorylase